MSEKELFVEALDRTDPVERAAYLDQACAGNPQLRERIERLLAAHGTNFGEHDQAPPARSDSSETFDQATAPATGEAPPRPGTETVEHPETMVPGEGAEPATDADPDVAPATKSADSAPPTAASGEFLRDETAPGDRLDFHLAAQAPSPFSARLAKVEGIGSVIAGRYTLLDVIGEGGMGSVYLAGQTEPVKRQVALKLIKSGMDSRGVLARFDAERQALAMMDHPNIARIYDGGLTPAGQPFFVMELVKGVPLTEYCDRKRMSVRARLELFVAVCHAVQHAHQKGIIHRDLKPGNVLVTEVDGRPTPKVIDFGVAKATEVKLTEMSFADVGAIVGTPAYMSPEQADPSSMDIDTRTDVYALGVMLYELLVGSPPLDARDFKRGAVFEMLRMVREVDPPRPSTKLSAAEALPNIAANRSIEPARLAKLLQGELDWVVMKALEKDRGRRYDTADGFARDIQRYLADEVVEARPPSRGYRLKKFVKRNKLQVVSATLVVLTLIAGIAGTSIGMIRAEQRRKESDRNFAFAKKGNLILGSVFAGLDPRAIAESRRPLQDLLRENLVKAVKELDGAAIGDPLEVAEMQEVLGQSLWLMGAYELAEEVLKKARATYEATLGPDHNRTLGSRFKLGEVYDAAGMPAKALPLKEETLALAKATLGPDHPDTVKCMGALALSYEAAGRLDEALPLFEKTLAMRRLAFGPVDKEVLIGMNNLAEIYRRSGKLDKAMPLKEETLALMKIQLGPDHPNTLNAMANLALGYEEVGKRDEALPLLEEALALQKAKLGPDHPDALKSMFSLATHYENDKRLDKALPLMEECVALSKDRLGPDHPDTINRKSSLAICYVSAGKMDKGLPLLEESLALTKVKLGPDHAETLRQMSTLGHGYTEAGRLDKALPLMEETLALKRVKLGVEHPDTLIAMNNLAAGYWRARRLDKSVPLLEEALSLQEKASGRSHPTTLRIVANLGVNYADAGRLKEAIPLLEEAHLASRRFPQLRFAANALINAYSSAGEGAKLADLLREELPEVRKALPGDSPELAAVLAQVGTNFLQRKKWVEAEPILRECLGIREKSQPEAWTTFNTRSQLGGALLGRQQFAEAEPLLLKGYEGMKRREATIPAPAADRLPEALDRLVELYTATNKPDEVKKWRAEREKYPAAVEKK